MRRKAKRATREEIRAFEESMRNGAGPQAGPCLCDFVWLDDAALAALPQDSLLKTAARYRDIIMGLLEERKELTSAFRTVMERNNILLTDVFGRKSEKLSVLLGGSRPEDGQPGDDGGNGGDGGAESPVKSYDSGSVNEGGSQERQEDSTGSGTENGTGQEGDGGEKKGTRTWKPKRTKGCLDKQCRDLPVIEKAIEMTEEELESVFGKGNFRRMEGNDKEVIEYEYVPRTIYVRRTILCAYGAVDKEADGVKKEMAVARNPVVRLRQCSRVTSSVWALALHERYAVRLPWERVSSGLREDGLLLPPQMMEENARFFYGILAAVIQRMWHWLFQTRHIQIDETPVLVYDQVRKALRRCYFWVFTVSELYETDKPVTIFVYADSKGTGVLRKYLVEDHAYSGYATTDGHEPYHIIEEETGGAIRNTGCLNHFRTRLARVLKAIPGLKEMTEEDLGRIPAYNALSSLQVVFKKEKDTAGMTAGEREAYRLEHVFPELEKAFGVLAGLDADDYGQGSLMHKALTYRDNQQEYLKRFLEDGSVPLTNSNSERHMAFFALLRNVSRFFGSDTMGVVGAGWETLAQTAGAFTDHVDIYFQYLLDEAVPFIRGEDSKKAVRHTARSILEELERNAVSYFCDSRLDRFMPWSSAYRAYEEKRLRERRSTARLLAGTHESSTG